jgi:hypothetical protein
MPRAKAASKDKMIKMTIYFYTNDLASGDGNILKKHAWTTGVVQMRSNKSHDIPSQQGHLFNSLMEIPSIIEQVIIDNQITLHKSSQMNNYIK